MSIVLIVIAVLIIWFIWGLNNKNKTADKIVARGGMREVYATLIEACSPAGEVRVIKEGRHDLFKNREPLQCDVPNYSPKHGSSIYCRRCWKLHDGKGS